MDVEKTKNNALQAFFPEEYEQRFWKENIRSDGRALDQVRPISIAHHVSSAMDSSCMAKVGRTTMIAGCKLHIGMPSVAKPDQGEIGK